MRPSVSIDEAQVRQVVRAVLNRTLGLTPRQPAPPAITAQTIAAAAPGAEVRAAPAQVITPLAREAARERGVSLVEPRPADRALSNNPKVVALGADHGGYELKQLIHTYLIELGYQPIDCGTFSRDPVDYPDIALAVAELVAGGRAARGILIDGAGLGSCMAANKVPHIRAALCYDQATAVNSREHNDANVLTLGAGLIGPVLARQIVKTWLDTPFGGGRHTRRVDKITAIEQRFSK